MWQSLHTKAALKAMWRCIATGRKALEKGGTFGRLLLTAMYACAVTCAPARASSSGVVCLLAMSRLFRGASLVFAAAPAPSLTNGTPPAKLQKSTHVLVQPREV